MVRFYDYVFWMIWFINQRANNHALFIVIVGIGVCLQPSYKHNINHKNFVLVYKCAYVRCICTSSIILTYSFDNAAIFFNIGSHRVFHIEHICVLYCTNIRYTKIIRSWKPILWNFKPMILKLAYSLLPQTIDSYLIFMCETYIWVTRTKLCYLN